MKTFLVAAVLLTIIGFGDLFSFVLADAPGAEGNFAAFVKWSVDFLLHLPKHLKQLVADFGIWSHLILFAIIFCETGLVFTPFLPGDSLLFAAGALAADGSLKIELLIPLLTFAAILGDTVNYWMGHWFGEHAFSGKIPFLKPDYLKTTHAFFEKHGGKAVILGRFIPLVRTGIPFVAGMGAMNYRLFLVYNVIGGVIWVIPLLWLGLKFGQMPLVQKNFELVILGIVGLSVLPIVYEVGWHWFHKKRVPVSEPAPIANHPDGGAHV